MSKVTDIVEDEAFTFSSNEQVHQLEVISQLLEAKLKALEDIDQDILSLCNVDEIPQEIEESERYVEKVITCQKKMFLNRLLEICKNLLTHSRASFKCYQEACHCQFLQVKSRQNYRNLFPQNFAVKSRLGWDFGTHTSLQCSDNVNLSKIDKFNYLRSLLEGATSQAIQGLALSSDNYDSAVEILEQRFGKTQ